LCEEKDAAELEKGNEIVANATLSELNSIRLGLALKAEPAVAQALAAPINIRSQPPVRDENEYE
jgi:hypothetical protein